VNLRGFWNKDGKRIVRKTQFHSLALRQLPRHSCLLEGTWRDHPDRAAAQAAERSLCTLPKVARHDG
jgi:hypothetical protein